METPNEQRFREESRARALVAEKGLPPLQPMAKPHSCRCHRRGDYMCKERRIRKLRMRIVLCAIATISAWFFVGVRGGYLFGGGGCTKKLPPMAWAWAGGGEVVLDNSTKMHNDFSKITPTEDLNWKPCYDKFLCTRLIVPLDYSRPNGPKAAIAMIKLPAKNPRKGQPSILINPGGPSGSGCRFALTSAEAIQYVVGDDKSIIGFDPRGVNNTTPGPVDCFSSCYLSRERLSLRLADELKDLSHTTMPMAWARIHSLGHLCNNAIGDIDSIGPHVSTPVVARDMISIVDAEQREAGSKEVGKLHYWGFSYGSVLGSSFATMYPDRVGRLIVDGICDLDDYYRTDWKRNLRDADYVYDQFFELCHKAGKEKCSFYADSPKKIRARLDKLVDDLDRNPLIIYNKDLYDTEIINGADVRATIAIVLYNPLIMFPVLSDILVALEDRLAEKFSGIPFGSIVDTCSCRTFVPNLNDPISEALMSIACSDGDVVEDTMEEFLDYTELLRNQSTALGDFFSRVRLQCSNYRVKAAWKFPGLPKKGQVETSHPMLFVSTFGDPVTPLENAHAMSKRFKGSSVLIQNSLGHCSMSSPSICSFQHIRNYYDKGILPPANATCEPDLLPFLGMREGTVRLTAEEEYGVNMARKVAANIQMLGANLQSKLLP